MECVVQKHIFVVLKDMPFIQNA